MWKNNKFTLNAVGELGESVNTKLPVLAKLFDHEVRLVCLFVNNETVGAEPFDVSHENAECLNGLYCIMWLIRDGKATRTNVREALKEERQLWSQYQGDSHGGQPTRGHDRWIILEEVCEVGSDPTVEIA